MKKKDVITLFHKGFLKTTAHCLNTDNYYSWYRFRRTVTEAMKDLADEQSEIFRQCEIDDPNNVPEDKAEKYQAIFDKVLEETVQMPNFPRIPIAYYKSIYDENKTEDRDIFSDIEVESIVIDNLFIDSNK